MVSHSATLAINYWFRSPLHALLFNSGNNDSLVCNDIMSYMLRAATHELVSTRIMYSTKPVTVQSTLDFNVFKQKVENILIISDSRDCSSEYLLELQIQLFAALPFKIQVDFYPKFAQMVYLLMILSIILNNLILFIS